MDVRDELQDEIVDQFIRRKTGRGTLVLPTGFGKSYIAMKIIKKLNTPKVLILVNSQILRDDNWREEFEGFGMGDYYRDNVTTKTYQYLYKKAAGDIEGFDDESLIILDEVDFIANTEKLSLALSVLAGYRILGLTGFITSSKKGWFTSNLPVMRSLSIKEAEDAGLVNKLKLYVVRSPMSQVESDAYNSYVSTLADYNKQLGQLNVDLLMGVIEVREFNSATFGLKFRVDLAIRARARFLYSLGSSVAMSIKLLKYFHVNGDDTKSVVFSKLTEQSGKISKNVYNGTQSAKENREIFRSFNSSEIKNLGVVAKINRGVSIKRLNLGIWEAYTSSDTQFAQQSGRLRRLNPDETATAVIIIPYYKSLSDEYVPTQSMNWATKMIRGVSIENTKVWDFCKNI